MVTDTLPTRIIMQPLPDKLAYPELTQVTLGLFAASAELARKGIG